MKKEVLFSPFRNNVPAKKGKIFLAALVDYGLTLVMSMLVFSLVGLTTFSALPAFSEKRNLINESETELNETVSETGLVKLDEDKGTLISTSEMAKSYIATLTKTSFYLEGANYPISSSESESVKKEETFFNVSLDPLRTYFFSFKAKEASLSSYEYDGVDYSNDLEKGLYEYAFGYGDSSFSSYFLMREESLPKYQQLDYSIATKVADYLAYGDSGGLETYRKLESAYSKANTLFVNEVESNYSPYLAKKAVFDEAYSSYTLSYILCVHFSYALALALCELWPLFSKRKVTLGYSVHKLAYTKEDETKPSFYQYLIKSLFRLVEYSSIPFIVLFFFSQMGLFFVSFGYFYFIYIPLLSVLLLVLSSLNIGLAKLSRPLPELASGLVIKDTEELEPVLPKEENRSLNDGK